MTLTVRDATVTYDEHAALDGVTLEVGDGRTVAVIGPSGCGKTTLLRVITGLTRPDAGRVLLDGADVTRVPTHTRGIGLMFQDHALFPHRDVGDNVAFGLRMAGVGEEETARRIQEALELVGLPGMQRRAIGTLSGGEQQRVALARALAPEPRVLLLDEPLGSLDAPLRARLADDLAVLLDPLTVVYVTHDVGEAFALADEVAIMRDGRILQRATPDDLWAEPADPWVAGFLGMANVAGGRVIRPEAVTVVATGGAGNATVTAATRRGPLVRLRVRLDAGGELEGVTTDLSHPVTGDRVDVSIDPAGIVDVRV